MMQDKNRAVQIAYKLNLIKQVNNLFKKRKVSNTKTHHKHTSTMLKNITTSIYMLKNINK